MFVLFLCLIFCNLQNILCSEEYLVSADNENLGFGSFSRKKGCRVGDLLNGLGKNWPRGVMVFFPSLELNSISMEQHTYLRW